MFKSKLTSEFSEEIIKFNNSIYSNKMMKLIVNNSGSLKDKNFTYIKKFIVNKFEETETSISDEITPDKMIELTIEYLNKTNDNNLTNINKFIFDKLNHESQQISVKVNPDEMIELLLEYSDEIKKGINYKNVKKFIINKINEKNNEYKTINNIKKYLDLVNKFNEKYGEYVDIDKLRYKITNYLNYNNILLDFQVRKKFLLLDKLEKIFIIYLVQYYRITEEDYYNFNEQSNAYMTGEGELLNIYRNIYDKKTEYCYKYLYMKFLDNDKTNLLDINDI